MAGPDLFTDALNESAIVPIQKAMADARAEVLGGIESMVDANLKEINTEADLYVCGAISTITFKNEALNLLTKDKLNDDDRPAATDACVAAGIMTLLVSLALAKSGSDSTKVNLSSLLEGRGGITQDDNASEE